MTVALHGLVALLGLAIGSFLNVVIHRVPAGQSVVRPRSACPVCRHTIRGRDNIPVLSWLLLRGRCRDCGTSIPVRYPAVEVATAVLFVAVWARFGTQNPGAVPALLYVAAIGVALTMIDLDTRRLPDAIVLPSYLVIAALLTVASLVSGDWAALGRSGIGGAALFIGYFLMAFAYPGGMGFGDVKLAGVLGAVLAWVGWGAFVVGSFAAFLLGGGYAIALLVTRRAGRRSGIPFGPWMLAGAALGLFVGERLFDAYLALLT